MVSTTAAAVNGDGASEAAAPETASSVVPPALAERPVGLPPGNYALVGWDLDTTGRRLIDEICQIAAYTPKSTFSQYIMPYGDLNPGARRRHNVKVVTVGRYRMLTDSRTRKVLKTKSEVSALIDFLEWLEKEKGDATSVILIYHEPRRLCPTMLLEALIRYNLLERFQAVVAGFADGYALAHDKCRDTVKSVTLRVLAHVLLDAEGVSVEAALDRATAAYRIVEHLSQGEQQELTAGSGDGGAAAAGLNMVEVARACARPVASELAARATLKQLVERQNTFRPVFGPLLVKTSRQERQRASGLRRLLAEAGLRYDQLKEAWEREKIDGLTSELASLSVSAKEDEVKELIEILDCHFDPEKQSKKSKPREPRNKKFAHAGNTTTSSSAAAGSDTPSQDTASSGPASPAKNSSSETGLTGSDAQSADSSNRSQTAVAN